MFIFTIRKGIIKKIYFQILAYYCYYYLALLGEMLCFMNVLSPVSISFLH